jgi:hypothetical protein
VPVAIGAMPLVALELVKLAKLGWRRRPVSHF